MSNKKTMLINEFKFLPLLLTMSLFSLGVQSADWMLAPGIALEQVYTDNSNLDSEKESDWITMVRPRISVYREAARANVDLSYAPEYRHYWKDTQSNDLVHFLRSNGDIELVENHFFIDGWATADQRRTTSGGRSGVDGLTGTDDLTNTYTAGISPYFTTRLGRSTVFEARYGLDRVYNDDDETDSSTGQRVDLVLGSGASVKETPWEVHLEQSNISYDDAEDDDKIQRAVGEVAYQINRKWSLGARLGYENYELAANDDDDSEVWSLGFLFTPNSRTRLAAGYGKRVFGDDYYLDFSHRSRRTIWTANYTRDVASSRDEASQATLFQRQDAFGDLVRDPVLSSPVTVSSSGPTLSDEYYRLDRFNTTFTLAMQRTTATLNAAYAKRKYEDTSLIENTRDIDFSAAFTRQIRSHTTGFLNLSWIDHDEGDADYEQWLASLGGSYQLGPHTSLGLTLAHLDRNASGESDSYEENRVSLNLDKSW